MKVFQKLDERRIRYLLAAFFVALAIPAAVLIAQAYSQLKWEAFRSNQLLAEDFAVRVDASLGTAMAEEEARSFGDYAFLVVEGDAAANFVQRSPLAAYPVEAAIPGVLGYFQVDADGELTTPLLPEAGVDAAAYGIGAEEQNSRRALVARIGDLLAANRLVQRAEPAEARASAPVSPAAGASSFAIPAAEESVREEPEREVERLIVAPPEREAARLDAAAPSAAGRVEADVDADADVTVTGSRIAPSASPAPVEAQTGFDELTAQAPVTDTSEARNAFAFERQKRTEQGLLAEPSAASAPAAGGLAPAAATPEPTLEVRVRTFESELDPFEIGLLDTGHLVMFRNAWRDGRRYVQGALIERDRFVAETFENAFAASSLAAITDLSLAYRGERLTTLAAAAGASYPSADELEGSALYRARLSPPFGDLELVFGIAQLPLGPGSWLLGWITVTLAAVLVGGFFFMYRFAMGQVRLSRQQQDFVSAVSHELKTPLTSIRMYGEMLKAGWADDAKKQTYYDYIESESERLSRLIENVLQLARLTRSTQHFDMKRVAVAELMDMICSKVGTQVERAGFMLEMRNDAPAEADVLIDADSFTQIVINLVDNALKFSAGAARKTVQVGSRRESDSVLFTVRDFGPGVPKGQMKKIFELFYRPENELTRETVGTGIGLALVHQLTKAMGGRVDVRNCEPGAEFRLSFPA